jgi:HEAT repeat protein
MLQLERLLAKKGFLKPLRAILKQPDSARRMEAAKILAELENPKTIPVFAELLSDPTPSIRLYAASHLKGKKAEETIEPLKKALADQEKKVRFEAARALISQEFPTSLWGYLLLSADGGEQQQLDAQVIFAEAGIRATDMLVEALQDGEWTIRAAAADRIGELKLAKAIEPLNAALSDPDEDVRRAAASALAEIADPSSAAILKNKLKSESENLAVRHAAARALTRIDRPESLDGFVWLLGSPSDQDRQEALDALRSAGAKSVPPLTEGLKTGAWPVRSAAASLLGEFGDTRAVQPLSLALQDPEPKVRRAAAPSLGKLKEMVAFDPLIKAMRDTDTDVRSAAIIAIGALQTPKALPILERALHDKTVQVRISAAYGLGELNLPEAVPPLIKAMADKEAQLRTAAAEALGRLKNPHAVPSLCIALKDLNDSVRAASALALGEMQDLRAVEPLCGALNDWYSTVCLSAAQSLLRYEYPNDLFGYAWLLGGGSDEEKALALEKIEHAARDSFEPLCATLNDWHSEVRRAAAEALGGLGDKRATAPLAAELEKRPLDGPAVEAVFAAFDRLRSENTGTEIAAALMRSGYGFDEPSQSKMLASKIRNLVKEGWLPAGQKEALRPVYVKLTEN